MTEAESPNARIIFELAVEDGWPPVGSERVWAFALGDDRYRIDNVPWSLTRFPGHVGLVDHAAGMAAV